MLSSMLDKCPICVSSKIAFFETHEDKRKGMTGQWNLWSCQACRLLFLNPTPTTNELNYYYSQYSKSNEYEISISAGSKYNKLRELFHLITGDIDPRDFIKNFSGKRILDFGFGQAPYLNYFASNGANIAGIEIAGYIVSEYEKHEYDVKKVLDFDHIPYPDDEFDVIYLMQVFEHIANPRSIFREINRIAKKQCTVYMAMPNSKSFWRKFFGKNWIAGWFTPFHLYFYDSSILTNLAKDHGFVLTKYWSSTPELWFRLNLKSLIFKGDKEIDSLRLFWLDNIFSRILIMLVLRFFEIFIKERDCLVVKLEKKF